MSPDELRLWCDAALAEYHHPRFISPDPLELVIPFGDLRDREIVAFVASALATGRVAGILRTVKWVLERMPSPFTALTGMSEKEIEAMFGQFIYRFFDGRQLSGLLIGLKRVLEEYGSLEACFGAGTRDHGTHAGGRPTGTESVVSGVTHLAGAVRSGAGGRLDDSILVVRPALGSACKRLFLFARWMVRSDQVDPGGWTVISPADLLVPVDTHMLAVCRSLGLTAAKQPSLAVAREITGGFRAIAPDDPVRYDFCLTRLGIHPEARTGKLSRKISGFP